MFVNTNKIFEMSPNCTKKIRTGNTTDTNLGPNGPK